MARVKVRNPIVNRILIFLIVIIAVIGIIFLCYKVLWNSYNKIVFDLGEKVKLSGYHDVILADYDSYLEVMTKYDLPKSLHEDDFKDNYYLASFQEFDSCSESKYKTVDNISYDDGLLVTYRVYNKCGWCNKNIILYLVKIKKIDLNTEVNYEYNYANNNECGVV